MGLVLTDAMDTGAYRRSSVVIRGPVPNGRNISCSDPRNTISRPLFQASKQFNGKHSFDTEIKKEIKQKIYAMIIQG